MPTDECDRAKTVFMRAESAEDIPTEEKRHLKECSACNEFVEEFERLSPEAKSMLYLLTELQLWAETGTAQDK